MAITVTFDDCNVCWAVSVCYQRPTSDLPGVGVHCYSVGWIVFDLTNTRVRPILFQHMIDFMPSGSLISAVKTGPCWPAIPKTWVADQLATFLTTQTRSFDKFPNGQPPSCPWKKMIINWNARQSSHPSVLVRCDCANWLTASNCLSFLVFPPAIVFRTCHEAIYCIQAIMGFLFE